MTHPARRLFQGEAGGGGGIRTHEARKGLPAFEAGPFNRSGTPPRHFRVTHRIVALSSRACPESRSAGRRAQRGIGIWPNVFTSGSYASSASHARLTRGREAAKVRSEVGASGDEFELEESPQAAVPD